MANKTCADENMIMECDSEALKKLATNQHLITFTLKNSKKGNPFHNDVHWRPTLAQCLPCNFNIDYIIQTETATQDSEFIFSKVLFPENRHNHLRIPDSYDFNQAKFRQFGDLYFNATYKYLPDIYKLALKLHFNFELEKFGYRY